MDHGSRSPNEAKNVISGSDNTIDKMKSKASESVAEAKRKSKGYAETQKDRAADRVEDVSHALDQASQTLREQDQVTLAEYADRLASSVTSIAETFRSRNLDDLVKETETLARRDPGLFLAGSVGAGFILSRFFKASSTRSAPRQPEHISTASEVRQEPVEGADGAISPAPGHEAARDGEDLTTNSQVKGV